LGRRPVGARCSIRFGALGRTGSRRRLPVAAGTTFGFGALGRTRAWRRLPVAAGTTFGFGALGRTRAWRRLPVATCSTLSLGALRALIAPRCGGGHMVRNCSRRSKQQRCCHGNRPTIHDCSSMRADYRYLSEHSIRGVHAGIDGHQASRVCADTSLTIVNVKPRSGWQAKAPDHRVIHVQRFQPMPDPGRCDSGGSRQSRAGTTRAR
jgi:hypothetical protein